MFNSVFCHISKRSSLRNVLKLIYKSFLQMNRSIIEKIKIDGKYFILRYCAIPVRYTSFIAVYKKMINYFYLGFYLKLYLTPPPYFSFPSLSSLSYFKHLFSHLRPFDFYNQALKILLFAKNFI